MVTFDGLSAFEAGDDGHRWYPDFEGEAVLTFTRIAGGELQVDQPEGAPVDETLSVPIRLDSTTSSLSAWRGKRGTIATVATDDLSRTAVLRAVTNIRHSLDQSVTLATLEFTAL